MVITFLGEEKINFLHVIDIDAKSLILLAEIVHPIFVAHDQCLQESIQNPSETSSW